MDAEWIDLGTLDGFQNGEPVLKKAHEKRFVCVRDGDRVHALDDLCPHQGYPLSQGCVNGGILTCEWHNWKFDLATGECLFGGEPVKSYPTRVVDGRVHLDLAINPADDLPRFERGLAEALVKDDAGRALREALRIGAIAKGSSGLGALHRGFELLAKDGSDRAEYGFDHGLALLADVCSWVERGVIGAEEGFVAAAAAIAEPSRHLGARATYGGEIHDRMNPALVYDDLVAERRAEAEMRVRSIAREKGSDAARDALVPYVARHVYDYGHGAIFLTKAHELATRFPDSRESIFAATTVELAWATAETSLPPFRATQRALDEVSAIVEPKTHDDPETLSSIEKAVLAGEKPALEATILALKGAASPISILRGVARAAAVRVARFDRAWEKRLDAEVGILDVTHLVTFTEAAIRLAATSPWKIGARLAVLAAGFTGRLKTGDGASEPHASDKPSHASISAAAASRDLGSALALAKELGKDDRAKAYDELAPFCAFDAATRPIFYAHTVKMTEALRKLDAEDPAAGGTFLRCQLSFVVPRNPERGFRRVAFVAKKFLADGRPPEGLY